MRELAVFRKISQREGRQALGLAPQRGQFLPVAAMRAPLDAEHLALPQHTENLNPIQDTDGSFFYMMGYSALDGPDPLA